MRVRRGGNCPGGASTSRSSKNTVPVYSGPSPTRSPVLSPTNVTVQSARTASPSGTPASASRPEGTSSANAGRPHRLMAWIAAAVASRPPAARPEVLESLARLAPEPPGIAGGEHGDGEARGLREAREHVAVAAVVTAAADDDDAVRQRVAPAQLPQRRLAGALHQGVAGDAQRRNCVGVEGAHLRAGVQGDRQRHGLIILSVVPVP